MAGYKLPPEQHIHPREHPMNHSRKQLELLAPARTADIGIEAVNHGADAIYIGGPAFGARANAENTVADIERLARHAHRFGARVREPAHSIRECAGRVHDDLRPRHDAPAAEHVAGARHVAGER